MLFEGKDRRELQQAMKSAGRLPPGQSLTLKWQVIMVRCRVLIRKPGIFVSMDW
jgi:hypothetical protein